MKRFGIIPPNHELVTQLGKDGFNPFSHLPENGGLFPELFLVRSHGCLQNQSVFLKQFCLQFMAQVPLVT